MEPTVTQFPLSPFAMLQPPNKVLWVMTLPERTCGRQLSQMLKGVKSPENRGKTEVKSGPAAYLHMLNFILSSSENEERLI